MVAGVFDGGGLVQGWTWKEEGRKRTRTSFLIMFFFIFFILYKKSLYLLKRGFSGPSIERDYQAYQLNLPTLDNRWALDFLVSSGLDLNFEARRFQGQA